MTWREFWKRYWNFTFWIALIGGPLGLLMFLGGKFYVRFLEPETIEIKYACQFVNENYRVNGFFYKTKNEAFKDIEKYKRNEIVTIEFFPSNLIELQPNEKVYVVRYLNDSSLARIKIVDEIQNNDTTYKKGWIPIILLHDSICSQGRPGKIYKIDKNGLQQTV